MWLGALCRSDLAPPQHIARRSCGGRRGYADSTRTDAESRRRPIGSAERLAHWPFDGGANLVQMISGAKSRESDVFLKVKKIVAAGAGVVLIVAWFAHGLLENSILVNSPRSPNPQDGMTVPYAIKR